MCRVHITQHQKRGIWYTVLITFVKPTDLFRFMIIDTVELFMIVLKDEYFSVPTSLVIFVLSLYLSTFLDDGRYGKIRTT